MKTKPWNIYIDTNVWSSSFDDSILREETLLFFKRLENESDKWKLFISELVLNEISETKNPKLKKITSLVRRINPLELVFENKIQDIAKDYVKSNAIKNKSFRDALHIAYATFYEMDYLVSLNFDDINNITTIKAIQQGESCFGIHKAIANL